MSTLFLSYYSNNISTFMWKIFNQGLFFPQEASLCQSEQTPCFGSPIYVIPEILRSYCPTTRRKNLNRVASCSRVEERREPAIKTTRTFGKLRALREARVRFRLKYKAK
ncbi:hypothetical protein AVEN_55875-1 [Araneus ventricosus]|uniref:Uncharacterized protein n=1 Tax=Araneus ventricosus TaxID=182803 RepID=A0A4Y2PSM6_ARAVE|nr:hypothetical protein AVEN_55875-1 [Araneus ventricosus]